MTRGASGETRVASASGCRIQDYHGVSPGWVGVLGGGFPVPSYVFAALFAGMRECGRAKLGARWWLSGSAAGRGRWQLGNRSGAGAACACPIDAPSPSRAALLFLSPCFRLGASAMQTPPQGHTGLTVACPRPAQALCCPGGRGPDLGKSRGFLVLGHLLPGSLTDGWAVRMPARCSRHRPSPTPRGMPSPPLAWRRRVWAD